jgi:L-alanine-DL-glutamate epimerase-like enolase superfamily enzyme
VRITEVEALVLRTAEVDTTRADGTQDAFLVRVHTDEGIVGIGEGDTSPYVARTIVEMPSSHSIARGLGELLVGEDPLQIGPLWSKMFEGSYHYGRDGAALHTISALDMALWDLAGKVAGLPVSQLLGGRHAESIEVYASEVMPETPEEVAELAARIVAEGFGSLKLGWGPLGRDVGYDVELASAAREVLGPDRLLMIDGGMAYSLRSAQEFCRRTEMLGLAWFEEPFHADDIAAYARLAGSVAVPIACGEAHSNIAPFRRLAEAGVDVLQPDLGRCGGFTVARAIADLGREYGVLVVPHCFSTDVLLAASLQFVSTLAAGRLIEFPVTASKRAGSVLTSGLTVRDGMLDVPGGRGLGIDLAADEVSRRRVP